MHIFKCTLQHFVEDCFTIFLVQEVELTERVMPEHNTGNLMLFRNSVATLTSHSYLRVEMGPPAYSPYPRRLESLTIC